jgi:hypothetical protein
MLAQRLALLDHELHKLQKNDDDTDQAVTDEDSGP